MRILTQMGMVKVNEEDNYIADLRGAPTTHFNNQIFVYRLDAEVVREFKKHDSEVQHESPHSLIVFRIKKTLPKLKHYSLQLPETEEMKEKLAVRVGELVREGVGTRIDVLYNAILVASRELKLVRTT